MWAINLQDVKKARERIRPHLPPSPLRSYGALDAEVGGGVRVLVKHENHLPTNSFKVRNGLSVLTALPEAERRRGVVAASRGNHGQGLAWAGRLLGVPVTVCVPLDNNPDKNEAMRHFGAEVVIRGKDYDEAVEVAEWFRREHGMRLVHSTNDREVLAGAGTMTLELLEEMADVDAIVVAVGGGSLAFGALVVARALRPGLKVYGVQAAGASTIHDSWHAGRPVVNRSAATFADGLATRQTYEMTFHALLEGLAGFVTVTESEIADALRLLMRTTHNLCEGAGAAGLAGLLKMREQLAGQTVAVVLSGSNIDELTLRRVVTREL